jgi:hypothetical protein
MKKGIIAAIVVIVVLAIGGGIFWSMRQSHIDDCRQYPVIKMIIS